MGMKAGFIVGGIILIVIGAMLFFTIICFLAGIVLGVVGLVMLIYGLASSDPPVVYQQYPQQYQQPYYQQPQYPPPYGQAQQYPVQSQPQFPQDPQPAPPPRYEPTDTTPPATSEPDIELVICPSCGAGNPPDVTFCGQCAANIREQVMPPQ
jgi:hypothetical protein